MAEHQPAGPPLPRRGWVYEAFRWISLKIYAAAGWHIEGRVPETKKFVLIAAPHTSNWDLPLMLAVALYYRQPIKWMGKDTLFKWPIGGFMRWLGGIAIDRSKANNVVDQMVGEYKARDALVIAIPPEGTRSAVERWKTGFYMIAHGAGVPVALGFLDFRRRAGGILASFETTGNVDADMGTIQAIYAPVTSLADLRAERRR